MTLNRDDELIDGDAAIKVTHFGGTWLEHKYEVHLRKNGGETVVYHSRVVHAVAKRYQGSNDLKTLHLGPF